MDSLDSLSKNEQEHDMKKSNEPFWWALFGAGGALTALCVPVLLFLNGLAIPLGLIEAPRYENVLALAQHPLSRLFLFALISLSLFHWGHRFRFTLWNRGRDFNAIRWPAPRTGGHLCSCHGGTDEVSR